MRHARQRDDRFDDLGPKQSIPIVGRRKERQRIIAQRLELPGGIAAG